ncbi:MAG: hypothetical protein PHH57_07605 [Candidatus Omnitrophica bacterium]|nr:hypothetical protein [Candidatus Omnitrophota bacterium]
MPVEKLPETVPYLSNIRTLLSLPTVGSDKKTYKVHEEWEREQARRRQAATLPKEGQQGFHVVENLPPHEDTGKTRDAVGAELGMSGRTYEKAKTVYDYAKEGGEHFRKYFRK